MSHNQNIIFIKSFLTVFFISSVTSYNLTESHLNDFKLIFQPVLHLNILITNESNNSVFDDLITVIGNKTIILYNRTYLAVKRQQTRPQNDGNIIFSDFKNFNWSMDCFVNSLGIFVFIIDDRIDKEVKNTELIFQKLFSTWKTLGAIKIFILYNGEILCFNPFLWNESTEEYGAMFNFNNKLNRIDFRDLNGYPMRIDIFESTYSVGGYHGNSGNLNYFQGTDIEILRALMKSMNFTSKYISSCHPFTCQFHSTPHVFSVFSQNQ